MPYLGLGQFPLPSLVATTAGTMALPVGPARGIISQALSPLQAPELKKVALIQELATKAVLPKPPVVPPWSETITLGRTYKIPTVQPTERLVETAIPWAVPPTAQPRRLEKPKTFRLEVPKRGVPREAFEWPGFEFDWPNLVALVSRYVNTIRALLVGRGGDFPTAGSIPQGYLLMSLLHRAATRAMEGHAGSRRIVEFNRAAQMVRDLLSLTGQYRDLYNTLYGVLVRLGRRPLPLNRAVDAVLAGLYGSSANVNRMGGFRGAVDRVTGVMSMALTGGPSAVQEVNLWIRMFRQYVSEIARFLPGLRG